MAGKQRSEAVPPRPRAESELIGKIIDELAKAYPIIETYVGVRSSAGAGGSSGSHALPFNLPAYVFLHGRYWAAQKDPQTESPYPQDEHTSVSPCVVWAGWLRQQDRLSDRIGVGGPIPRCGRCSSCIEAAAVRACTDPGCGAARENWRSGFELTVFWLEAEIRITLGFGQVRRRGGHDVLDALEYIRKASYTLADDHPFVARKVRDELARIQGRSLGMIDGHAPTVTIGLDPVCEYCAMRTVHSVTDQAFCINPECTAEDGSRHCWRRDTETGQWAEVPEPDKRGRGRNLSHEELLKRAWGT